MSDRPTWLILPTFNERATLATVVTAARAAMAAEGEPCHVLIVDDDSPDGTGLIAEQLAGAYADVEVLHRRTRTGLGGAYLAGFELALHRGAAYIVEMDADLSHDPAELPRLVATTRAGADLALGSRYVAGGTIERWSLLRRCVSRFGCWYARTMLGAPVRDLTTGFRCFRAEALHAIDYATARSKGYAFQIELAYRALRRGCRVMEIPITFRERGRSGSKMTVQIAIEAAWRVPVMRWSHRARESRPGYEQVGDRLPTTY